MEVTGIILAGGKSSRIGVDKGLMSFENKPMIVYIIQALKKMTTNIIIVANNKQYEVFNLPVYSDLVKDKGPLGGIYTGLKRSKTEVNICVSCDTPLVTTLFFQWLLNESANNMITMPSKNGLVNPVIGIYKKGIVEKLKSSLDKDELKMMDVLSHIDVKVIEIPEKIEDMLVDEDILSNINTEEDLEIVLSRTKTSVNHEIRKKHED